MSFLLSLINNIFSQIYSKLETGKMPSVAEVFKAIESAGVERR